MARLQKTLLLLALVAGAICLGSAQAPAAAAAAPATAPAEAPAEEPAAAPAMAPSSAAEPAAGCRTALDLIAEQNPNLPLHPVFQKILASPDLKGTLFVPTKEAWDAFFVTLRQRKGNPESPQLIARYGQVLLYHLAQDEAYQGVKVPIAEPTPGANRFLVSTASTLQCSVGTGLPNNRILVSKTPQAIILQHGTGNATIRSQPMPYCGGEAYLVDQVLNPCSDVAAIMGEVANVPSPCRSNLESGLLRNQLSSFHALLLATGLSRKVYTSVQNFTMFVPSDAALEAGFQTGDFDYATMFAKDKGNLLGLLAYHIVPMYQYTAPSRATLAMDTLLKDGVGNVTCGKPKLAWRNDGYVYGGTGSAPVRGGDQGCNSAFFAINNILQPCCRNLTSLLTGRRGLATQAKNNTMEARSYRFLQEKQAEGGSGRIFFFMPSEAAWKQLREDAAVAKVNLTEGMVDGLMEYLYTRAGVSNSVVSRSLPVPTGLSRQPKLLAQVCGKLPADGQMRMAFAGSTAPGPAAKAPDATAMGAPLTAPAPAAAAPAAVAPAAAAPGTTVAAPMAAAPMTAAPISALVSAGRRLLASALLLPTTFTAPIPGDATDATGGEPLVGDLMVVDGASPNAALAIPVKRQTVACDATIFHVDTVPLPCPFIKRTVMALPPPPMPPPAMPPAPLMLETNTTANATAKSSATAAAASLAGSGLAAVLLSMMLL